MHGKWWYSENKKDGAFFREKYQKWYTIDALGAILVISNSPDNFVYFDNFDDSDNLDKS